MANKNKKSLAKDALQIQNRRARRNYEVMDRFEAGIELFGTEVKAIREGKVSIDEAFAQVQDGQLWVHQMRIEPYSHGNQFNHVPTRLKRLLMHKVEIRRLEMQVATKGNSLIPLKLYLKNGRIKMELGLCRGKNVGDKREDLKRRTSDREAERAMAEANRRG